MIYYFTIVFTMGDIHPSRFDIFCLPAASLRSWHGLRIPISVTPSLDRSARGLRAILFVVLVPIWVSIVLVIWMEFSVGVTTSFWNFLAWLVLNFCWHCFAVHAGETKATVERLVWEDFVWWGDFFEWVFSSVTLTVVAPVVVTESWRKSINYDSLKVAKCLVI